MAETFDLTPEQWSRLMEKLGSNYGAYDNLVSYTGRGYTYSRTFIVRGENEAEVLVNGSRAVATSGQGALADVQVRYQPGARSPSSFSVTTSDPAIIREIRGLESGRPISDFIQRMVETVRQLMTPPEQRQNEYRTTLEEMMGRAMEGQRRNAPQMREQEGGGHILEHVGTALEGTPFSVPSLAELRAREQQMRNIDPGIVRDFGPSTAVPMPNLDLGPNTGFMRYMEPDGTSSVYSGERRLYTDVPVFERNPFRQGSDRAVGTLRIYGELERPQRYEIITDNPALRSAAQSANIPVRPYTEHPPQEREHRRPPA